MDYEIRTFNDIYDVVQGYGDSAMTTVVYRGVRRTDFTLLPKIGRLQGFECATLDVRAERFILTLFKQQALPHLGFVPTSDWEWLAVGQHHGLPTRLLDWSRNPLVACYFAVEEDCSGDSVVYALRDRTSIDIANTNPFEISGVGRVIPTHITPRITAQAGLFTVHGDPCTPFETESLDRLIIPNRIRRELKKVLYKFGIHRASLFPGLDGLSRHIQWLRTNEH
ncbi:MAG: FRG domain-containing protein [Piscinibacter sp.]|uniref:FRG domain-containing protein n=1 Tax=Piscinibacter sp. TaxID=1903157 RepID=UPI002585B34E|nr:FRG domain-containing protein [Piscinibacter sp.]MCW5664628.1 FRG domain-containing protein [Piscinibacter sp.]